MDAVLSEACCLALQVVQGKIGLLLEAHFGSALAEPALQDPMLFGAVAGPQARARPRAPCLPDGAHGRTTAHSTSSSGALCLPNGVHRLHSRSIRFHMRRQERAGADAVCEYSDMKTYAAAKAAFEGILAAYNQRRKPMKLVFFDDALDHLLRLHRTLSLPQVRACDGQHIDACPQCMRGRAARPPR